VTAYRQIGERRQGQCPETGVRRIVLRDPGACIHLVMEGVVRRIRQVGLYREGYIRGRRQREIDLRLAG
jgi:hypothetical protein